MAPTRPFALIIPLSYAQVFVSQLERVLGDHPAFTRRAGVTRVRLLLLIAFIASSLSTGLVYILGFCILSQGPLSELQPVHRVHPCCVVPA